MMAFWLAILVNLFICLCNAFKRRRIQDGINAMHFKLTCLGVKSSVHLDHIETK